MPESRTFRLFVAVRELWRDRRPWVLAGLVVSAALAFYCARGSQEWTASSQVFVDSSVSIVGDGVAPIDPVQAHADLYTNVLASQAGINAIARASGLRRDQIAATSSDGASFSLSSVSTAPYSLTLQAWDLAPEIFVMAQAPTRMDAVSLTNGAVHGLVLYLQSVSGGRASSDLASIRQLGAPDVKSVGAGISLFKLALIGSLSICIWCLLIRLAERSIASWRNWRRRQASVQMLFGEPSSVELSPSVADLDR